MAIDWEDNTKRKLFREALQKVYPNEAELAMFVDEELNVTLATVAGGANLQVTAYGLLQWARAQGRLDEVYQAFKAQNPKNPVIHRLEQQPLVIRASNLTQNDWDTLFGLFIADDLADLKRAFGQGFYAALGFAFQQAQPQYPPLIELAQIRKLLEYYDNGTKGPQLAVRFVEFAIAEIRRSCEGSDRDLTALEQWCDRIAQQYNVPQKSPEPAKTSTCHAYLLVSLEEIGADVNVYPELHIVGAENPINFGAKPTTCPIDQVANYISTWIDQAEAVEAIQQCEEEEVILELFLPCRYLDEEVALSWTVRDKRNCEILLGTHRRFLIRSLDRVRDRKIQKILKRKWERLQECEEARNACSEFHLQEHCPEGKGTLRALLQDADATGLKLFAKLPADQSKRRDLLYDIIDAAVPIALWVSRLTEVDTITLRTEFDQLLQHNQLTNFASFARHWRSRRMQFESAQSIRLLCDHPDRLPRLPDPTQEEDLLVAS